MSKKVLIVEDYQDSRELMKMLIKSFGHEVLLATNGNEAIEIVRQETPDLILMDIALPLMDGLTATEIIRTAEDIPEIPIVAITSHGNVVSEDAIKAGCNEVINKPIDFSKLEPLINEYLGD
jgi:two-component system cell cycle response regulator DivK